MAEVDRQWWPVDKVILAYLAATALLVLLFFPRVPGAAWILGWHLLGAVLLVAAVKRPTPWGWVFRHWYPLPYVAACYREMSILIPAIRGVDLDQQLARLDYGLWNANPTVWLERWQSPLLTELLQISYSLFVPCVLLVAFLLWRRGELAAFRRYAFLIALGFLVSYVGYFLVPARGPRFLLRHLQTTELRGLWLFQPLQVLLDRLESAHYDCFPSGHTELTMLAWWGSRTLSIRYFLGYLLYTLSIIFATVYLRYHYTVDVLAGAVVAAALIWAAPHIYDGLREKGPLLGGNRDRQC